MLKLFDKINTESKFKLCSLLSVSRDNKGWKKIVFVYFHSYWVVLIIKQVSQCSLSTLQSFVDRIHSAMTFLDCRGLVSPKKLLYVGHIPRGIDHMCRNRIRRAVCKFCNKLKTAFFSLTHFQNYLFEPLSQYFSHAYLLLYLTVQLPYDRDSFFFYSYCPMCDTI